MEKISSVNGYVDFKSTNHSSTKSDSFNQQPDEHSTIIHNHIPITIESPSPSNKQFNKYNSPTSIQKDQSLQSSTENIYNSYGQQLKQSLGQDSSYVYQPYPPFSETRENPPTVKYLQEPHVPYTSFENVQFNSFQNQNPQNQIYPSTPHLNNDNVNNLINLNTPLYPTLRPHSVTPANNAVFYQNQASPSYTNEDISETINKYLNNQNNNKNDEQQLYSDGNTANGYVSIDGDDNNDGDDEYSSNNNDIDSELNVDGDDGNDDSNVSSLLSNINQKQKLELENKQLPDRSTSAAASDDVEGKKQLVHYGDSFMTLEAYKANVEPLLFNKATHNIEYVTCITGARQPSSTDCTKYFVCNAKTNKVLTYSCPDYTGFNSQSRFCDAATFAKCRPAKISPSLKVTIDDNRRIQEQSKKALLEAQRVREEAIKAQQLTALIKLETQNILNAVPGQSYGQATFTRRRPQNNKRKQTHKNIITTTTTTTRRPPFLQKPQTNDKKTKRPPQRRLIKCSEPTKVADSLSIYNYFTCYKDNGGTLKAMKMTCPNGLMFCAKTKLCTSSDRC